MAIDRAYDESHEDFRIDNIQYEDDAEQLIPTIEFEYTAPAITKDAAGRFAEHEIIGGATVRQKIGEKPIEVSITGVCTEETAKQLDGLRDARYGDIYSQRFIGGSLRVQFVTASTQPLEDTGAVALDNDSQQFLYTYDLECTEVIVE